MGNCVDKDKKRKISESQKQLPNNQNNQMEKESFTIQINQGSTTNVKFNHSPLSNCPFLHDKFVNSANKPAQVNLTFMILGIQFNQHESMVSIGFINEKQINIYFILGGQVGMSSTGLLVDIKDARFVHKTNRKQPTSPQGGKITIVTPQLSGQNIMVVIEPNLKDPQSMYVTNSFVFNPTSKNYSKKQSLLQWSSLSFNLQDIYGAETEFRCDKVEDCSVCLSSPANVILTPCRHMCLCNLCSKKYEKIERRCPICRAEFHAFIEYM